MITESREYIADLRKWREIFVNRIEGIDKQLKEIEEMEE